MRLIVACEHCRRQYDAAGIAAGSRFHCVCGEGVEVVAPRRGHDAAVVRCSACGAARGNEATNCGHCRSDFTLHERDLHTVCPQCAARVSDRAKFCHHCGQSLASTAIESVVTTLPCPYCEDTPALHHRTIGDPALSVMECQRCIGLWLDHGAVEELVRRAERVKDARQILPRRTGDATGAGASHAKWRYRKCPHCRELMNRRNLGRASGVIVDACSTHGVWFDDEELHALLDWVHAGGQAESARPDVHVRAARPTPAELAVRHGEPATPTSSRLFDFDLLDVLAFALRLLD